MHDFSAKRGLAIACRPSVLGILIPGTRDPGPFSQARISGLAMPQSRDFVVLKNEQMPKFCMIFVWKKIPPPPGRGYFNRESPGYCSILWTCTCDFTSISRIQRNCSLLRLLHDDMMMMKCLPTRSPGRLQIASIQTLYGVSLPSPWVWACWLALMSRLVARTVTHTIWWWWCWVIVLLKVVVLL